MVSKSNKKKQVSQQQQSSTSPPPATSTTTSTSSAEATKLTKKLGPDAFATLTTSNSSSSMQHESVTYGGDPVGPSTSGASLPAAGVRSYSSRSSQSKSKASQSHSSYTEQSQSQLQSEQYSSKFSRDYANQKIISSIDLLESEKRSQYSRCPSMWWRSQRQRSPSPPAGAVSRKCSRPRRCLPVNSSSRPVAPARTLKPQPVPAGAPTKR